MVRINARPKAITPIAAPPINVSCKLIHKPFMTVGKTSLPYSISKKVVLTVSQPGLVTRITNNVPSTKIEEAAAILACLRLIARRDLRRSISRELGDHAELCFSDMVAKLPLLLLSSYYGFNTGAPASVASHLSVIAAKVPSAVIASTAPDTHEVNLLPFVSKRPN